MRRLALSALAVLAVPLSAAPVPKELKRTDARAILGTWENVVHTCDGNAVDKPRFRWRLEEGGIATILNPNEVPVVYALRPEMSPKHLDWQIRDISAMAIYSLEGDTLKVAISGPGGVRPTELKPGPGVFYSEFKRLPPEAKR